MLITIFDGTLDRSIQRGLEEESILRRVHLVLLKHVLGKLGQCCRHVGSVLSLDNESSDGNRDEGADKGIRDQQVPHPLPLVRTAYVVLSANFKMDDGFTFTSPIQG